MTTEKQNKPVNVNPDPELLRQAQDISRRTPVALPPIYRALLHHSAEEVEAAIQTALCSGVDPRSFPVYLVVHQDNKARPQYEGCECTPPDSNTILPCTYPKCPYGKWEDANTRRCWPR